MEIKLITTNATTSGVGVGFRFLGNVEIAKPKPILFGTTTSSNQTVGFNFNNVETTINSNDDGYFELYRDSNEPITQFSRGTNYGRLKTLNVSNLDTSQVTNMRMTFSGCNGLTSLDVSKWNTSQVTNMYDMFYSCRGLTSLDVSKWNTSQVTNMGSMFSGCSGLTSLDLSNWNTAKVTNMSDMFNSCSGLTSLDVSHFDTSKVTNMSDMFNSCSKLTSLDVSNFDTSKVSGMNYMFSNCNRLASLDLSNFVTSQAFMRGMFNYCFSLRTIKINDRTSANELIDQINKDLHKTATWDSTTKEITIPA